MTSYTFCKCALTIVILLAFVTTGRAQVAPTPEQVEFVSVLSNRIGSKSQAEITMLQTQLQPAITAEQQAEGTRNDLIVRSFRISGRIECMNWLVREYPSMRGNTDPNIAQRQVTTWRRELLELNRQLAAVKAQLNTANTALSNARERRLAAERNVASKRGTNIQQFSDLKCLYEAAQENPPRFNWQALMERLTAVAREKQLTSEVTISTGSRVTVRYQLASGGQVFSAANCTRCVVRLPVDNYNFWVETTGTAEPQRKAYLIFRESQSVQIDQPNSNTR